jgi:gliding motility-associated-like protein
MYAKDATGLVSIYAVTSSPLCPVNVTYVATDASCNQNDAILSLSPGYGNGPYTFTLDGINYQNNNTFTNLPAGNYTFTVKDANSVTFSGYATIKSKCPIVSASQTNPTCTLHDGTITATGGNGTSPYQFSIDGVNFQNSNLFAGLSAGNYIITIKDAGGYSDTASVTLNSNCLLLNINITNTVCSNLNGSITVSASSGTPPYRYSLDGYNFQAGTNFSGLGAGSYKIYAKDALGAIADSTVKISDAPGPQENVVLTQGSCSNPKGNINIVATGGTPPVQFSIDGINYQNSGVFDNLDSGKYITSVKDAIGCKTSDTVQITPGGCGLMLPNAFSPNGDGLNDIFGVKYPSAVKAFSLAVYNRLGEKIFETSDMAKGWDGTFKGIKQPVGVYVWIVHLTSLNDIGQTIRGIVTLLK